MPRKSAAPKSSGRGRRPAAPSAAETLRRQAQRLGIALSYKGSRRTESQLRHAIRYKQNKKN